MAIDMSGYHDLTLYDGDAQAITERALQAVEDKFPEWTPTESDMGVVLIEAMATEVVEAVYAINRIPGAVAEAILSLNGLTRSPGVEPTTTVTFTVLAANTDTLIPAGTRIALGDNVYGTDADLVVAAGSTTGTVAVTGVDVWSDTDNGTPAGTTLDMVDAIVGVQYAETASVVKDGALPEEDAVFLSRATTALSRLHATLVTPTQFLEASLDYAGVARALVQDRWDADYRGTGGDPMNPVTVYGRTADGHITVAVVGPDGAVTTDVKDGLAAYLQDRCVSILKVHVVAAIPQGVDVNATVIIDPDYDGATVQANIRAALAEYLNPAAWAWDKYVYRNELISVVDRCEGVMRVQTLTLPKAAVPDYQQLGGNYPLPTVGTLNITTTYYSSPVKIQPRTA